TISSVMSPIANSSAEGPIVRRIAASLVDAVQIIKLRQLIWADSRFSGIQEFQFQEKQGIQAIFT
ncbi:MAG: hypothetical protein KDA80_17660, partial [Planctomycetaceae bacterium]|nr:hypothetical protein [Planctomycetaceae bacterium]